MPALIQNLEKIQPKPGEGVLVDTNVWVYLTDTITPIKELKPWMKAYSIDLRLLHRRGVNLLYSSLSLMELAHALETKFLKSVSVNVNDLRERKLGRKNYATDLLEIFDSAWMVVKQMAKILPMNLDDTAFQRIESLMASALIDPCDLALADAALQAGIPILSNDSDMALVPGLTVFTRLPALIRV